MYYRFRGAESQTRHMLVNQKRRPARYHDYGNIPRREARATPFKGVQIC